MNCKKLLLKQFIIQNGILGAHIYQWDHMMALVGYGTVALNTPYYHGSSFNLHNVPIVTNPYDYRIGQPYWIFKNSWGVNSIDGNSSGDGYVYAIVDPQDFYSFRYTYCTYYKYEL